MFSVGPKAICNVLRRTESTQSSRILKNMKLYENSTIEVNQVLKLNQHFNLNEAVNPNFIQKEWSLLQVYHFQELSRTSIRDAIFERDGRYIQLKKDLQEEVNKLSPAQLLGSLFVSVDSGKRFFSLEEYIDLMIL